MNLPLVSMSMSDMFGIDAVTVLFLILHISLAKIHTDSKLSYG